MIPVVYRFPDWIPVLGDQAITSFGLALLVAFLAAGALFVQSIRRVEPDAGWDLVVTAVVTGILGAKLLHVAVFAALGLPSGGVGRGGLDWFGGLAGGAAGMLWHARRAGLATGHVVGAAAAPLALGYAIGRVGSFLVGADYGAPTGLPWGLSFPRGAPPTTPLNLRAFFGASIPADAVAGDFVHVHPAQLYEAALSLGIFGILRRRGRTVAADGSHGGGAGPVAGWRQLGLFLALSGAARVSVELIRLKRDRLFGPVTVDLLLALAAVVLGLALWRRKHAMKAAGEVA